MKSVADLVGWRYIVFYQCEEYACMLYETSHRAYFSQSVRCLYKIGDDLVPIIYVLWGIGIDFPQGVTCAVQQSYKCLPISK